MTRRSLRLLGSYLSSAYMIERYDDFEDDFDDDPEDPQEVEDSLEGAISEEILASSVLLQVRMAQALGDFQEYLKTDQGKAHLRQTLRFLYNMS